MRSQKARHKPRPKRACPLGGSSDPVGKCHKHHLTVSVRQMQNRNCLAKKCNRLEKYKDHPYWEWLAKQEEKRNEARQKTNCKSNEADGSVEAQSKGLAGCEGHTGNDAAGASAFRPDDAGNPEGVNYGY